jgi:DnaJ-class molecular chaperone
MPKQKDYYDVLGVKRDATTEQIRSSYRKLARQFHPDVNKEPDAAKRFAEVQEAYDVLSDVEKRKAYDRFGHAGVGAGPSPGSAGGGWGGFGGRERGGRTVWTSSGGGMGAEDLGSIFEEIFGGRAGGPRGGARPGRSGASPFDFDFESGSGPSPSQRGRDIEHKLTVSFMTAALGGSEQIRFTMNGATSTISVKIPAGIDSGGKLRIKGKGEPGTEAGSPGDLMLTVEVGRHPYFRREGLDLYLDVPITIVEAVRGTTVRVPLLKSEDGANWMEIKVPPGASSGRKLRIRGKGIADASGKKGDYYAVVQIVAPAANELSESGSRLIADLENELKNPRNSAPFVDG